MHKPYLVDYWETEKDLRSPKNHKTSKRVLVYAKDEEEAAKYFRHESNWKDAFGRTRYPNVHFIINEAPLSPR